ncbi:PREDICTED: uncharacterized protein LOC107072546 isoform X1 [Polistes dominula]|uniref:Uncharacterized protein LOC107072546 isoform X1 n=1 Tax=Polistes dominula TaxID=743375 RepID=A0ABM1J6H4_POLDO|nr:PREDICTED: uncharacterized protein LOC107072546 isoform X1 [Polistes dominula]
MLDIKSILHDRKWKMKNICRFVCFPRVILDLIVLLIKISMAIIVASFKIVLPTTTKNLIGEIVLITGAGRGIGRELAIQLGLMGCIVICWDVNTDANRETISAVSKNGGEVYGFVVDVSKRLEVNKALRTMKKIGIPPITILINNAAILYHRSLLNHSSDDIERTFNINVFSHFWTIEAILPSMLQRGKGHIVAICSMCGIYGVSQKVPYCSSKFAVRDFTMISEREKYATNVIKLELPSIKIILLFTIEYLIAITLYYLIRMLNYIKSLLPKPPRDLAGDVVVIIGATSTIGTSLAEEFAKRGCSIICIDKDNNLVQQLALNLKSRYTSLKNNLKGRQMITEAESLTNARIIAYQCDILNTDQMKDIVNNLKNEIGVIDILVTCINTPYQGICDTAMTIWMNHYSAIVAFLSLMLNRERVHIIVVTPVSSKDVSLSSGIAIANLIECLGEKLNDYLDNCTFLAISPITEERSIKQSDQQVARDIVEAVRRNQSSIIYGWSSHFLYRASYVMYVIITGLTGWYRD